MTDTKLAKTEAHTEQFVPVADDAPQPTTFKHVLVGVDGTSTSRDAIALAETLRHADGRITLAHVVPVEVARYRNFHSTPAGKNAHTTLARERAAAGVTAELAGMFAPSVGSGLHQLAEDYDADLIVVGSCRRSTVGRLLRGDDTQGSLSGAASAVAVAPLDYAVRSSSIDMIGVAYDGSSESDSALRAARQLAAHYGASVRARTVAWPTTAMVWPGFPAGPRSAWGTMTFEDYEREASERLSWLTGIDAQVTVGPPGDELLAFGDEVDLLVVGSRGHGPFRRLFLGSTSGYLARRARFPLLVLPRTVAARDTED